MHKEIKTINQRQWLWFGLFGAIINVSSNQP
jgi:hypothetical protein